MKRMCQLAAAALALLLLPVLSVCAATVPEETLPLSETAPAEEPALLFSAEPYQLYFGLLHAHTDLSDGLGSVEEAFFCAKEAGLDFFAVTDHSNSLDDGEWDRGRAAARDATDAGFLALFGYEMTWQEDKRTGHIAAFGTEGYLSREQAAFDDPINGLERYYRALTGETGAVAMLCHPGDYYGDFHHFGHYSPEYDRQLCLLEVVSGREGTFWDQYTRALDAGWHLAPSANQNEHNGSWGRESGVRTVVLAEALTQESLLSAFRQHRVYATEDPDLHLYYDLDGCIMGSVLSRADSPELTVLAWDPTDEAIGTVEVVTEGGQVLAAETTGDRDAYLTFSVSGGFRYYYLRITQPDGDMAVTAPVWVEPLDDMGIRSFSAGTDDPVQDQPIPLTLSLYNYEAAAFSLEVLELYADDEPVLTLTDPGTVAPGGELTLSFSYTRPVSGETELRAVVRGTVLDRSRSYEAVLPLRLRSSVQVTGILVDGSHENRGLDTLDRFCAIGAEEGLDLTLVTGDLPQGGQLLLIPDPQKEFDEHFLRDVRNFAAAGGDLILWGEKEFLDPLLEALGSSMELGTEVLEQGGASTFHSGCHLAPEQYFSHGDLVAVEPGQGQWLVRRGNDGPVLLAREETPWGGSIYLSGCAFLDDSVMPEQRSHWALPSANETILRWVLGRQQEVLAPRDIRAVRRGTPGQRFRIKGYVTAGTSDPSNRFPETIYLQDATGGIAVTDFTAEGIQVGAPMEVIGILAREGGNIVLQLEDYRLPEEAWYRWVPGTLSCGAATDYDALGGTLVQVEGRAGTLVLTEDKKGLTRLTVRDFRGGEAIVEIGLEIFSGATGENRLAKQIRRGRTVRAMGLVHINADGETVIRVRNCDEVVYVPPTTDLTNPATGDRAWPWPKPRQWLRSLLRNR